MLNLFTLAVMLVVAFYHWREGLFNAACLCICVVFSGLIAFNFWEPVAAYLETLLERGIFQGYEDFVAMVFLFSVALVLLRAATNALNNNEIEYLPIANQVGGGIMGLVTGYLLSGFLICAM